MCAFSAQPNIGPESLLRGLAPHGIPSVYSGTHFETLGLWPEAMESKEVFQDIGLLETLRRLSIFCCF